MATPSPVKRAAREFRRPPGAVTAVAVLLSFLVVGAFQGGMAMVTNPINPLGMAPALLDGTPVDDYFWPGLFLLAIAASSVVTLLGLLFTWRWDCAAGVEGFVGYRWPWIGAVAIGTVLLLFEIIELFMIPFHPVMHPLLIAGSLAIVLLAITPSARRHLRV